MKKTKKTLYLILLSFFFILLGTIKSNAGSLYLNNLEFETQINADGSMNVTETWDINVTNTNTLYKTFKTDASKYSAITEVKVKELISTNNEKTFLKTETWAYHVAKGSYYGTKNQDGDFEIGWGVGLDSERATKKYKISYKVEDAITKYNDCAELYWQFIGKDFEVSAKKIKGTIYLPSNVQNKDDIRVWGHTEGLNGTIYATDTNKIEFNLNNFNSGRFVEVRTLFPSDLITTTGRVKNTSILDKAVKEETKLADKANAKRKRSEWWEKNKIIISLGIYFGIDLILAIIFVRKTIKYLKKNKEIKKYQPETNLEYFRELPNEEATPGEAFRILNVKLEKYTPKTFGNIFSATMLDLTLKGYMEIKQEKDSKGKEITNINILKEADENLKPEEKAIFEFIKKTKKEEWSFTLKDLEKYIKGHSSETESLLNNSFRRAESQLIKEEIIDENIQKEYKKYKNGQAGYIFAIIFAIFLFFYMRVPVFMIPSIICIINIIICGNVIKKLNILTQKGVNQKEEWNGLKKYMEDFSLLNEKNVPELVIWEKYLVFATAFDIADKVIKQLKIVYPNFEEISNGIVTYSYMNIMMSTNFSNSFSRSISSSINSSIASTHSSGSGYGGGFSGGGGFGGGRRPEVEEDNLKYSITNIVLSY